jgi:toxin ParE1/3/4
MLAQFPEIGRNRPELVVGLRSFPVDSYSIFYRVIDGGIEIVRVLSGFRVILHTDLS